MNQEFTTIKSLIEKISVQLDRKVALDTDSVAYLISHVKALIEQEEDTHKVVMIFENGKSKEVYSNKQTSLVLLNQKENKTVVKELPVFKNTFIVEDAFKVVDSIHTLKTQIEEKF